MNSSQARSGAMTRSVILDHIRAAGRVSRVELAAASGLTQTAITNIVRQTIADGLVIEDGHAESTGGKRRTLLRINTTARHALGVGLDRERMSYVVSDLSGRMVARTSTTGSGDSQPAAMVARMAQELRELLELSQVPRVSVVGVGVASPGPLDADAGTLQGQQLTPAWRDFPLREQLAEAVGLPVAVDNDATCAALGQFWTTRGGAVPHLSATVYLADGIGSGILIDGRVFHGSSSNPGELGHLSLDADGPPCRCGGRGCVELYAAPRAVVAAALAEDGIGRRLELSGDPSRTRVEFARVVRAATQGDPGCRGLVLEAARRLGQGVVGLANLLDADQIALAGPGFTDGGGIFARTIQDQLDQHCFMRDIHPVRVHVSQLGAEAAAIGAAAMMLQQEVTPHSVPTRHRTLTAPGREGRAVLA